MRSASIALVATLAASAALGIAGRVGRAEEPAPLTQEETDRIRHLIDDLGSDDFRVREGAQKALGEFGARAVPALRAASSHSSAEVRFRAEQLLRSLEGLPRERRLGEDQPGAGGTPPLGGLDDMERELGRLLHDNDAWRERLDRQIRELREWMRRGFGGGRSSFPGLDLDLGGKPTEQVIESDGVRLVVKADGARLSVTKKGEDGEAKEHVVEAATLDELRRKVKDDPALRDDAAVASVLRQARFAGKRFRLGTDFQDLGRFFGPGGGMRSRIGVDGLVIEQGPGKTKVTLTERDADGKAVTKTYEGTDLEAIKREHPEIADRLGGLHFEFGFGPDFGPGSRFGPLFGDPFSRRRPRLGTPPVPGVPGEDEGDDAPEAVDPPQAETGPFGLQLAPLDETLRLHLGLAERAGARVVVVRADSAASQIGLAPHDVIVGVEGKNGRVEGDAQRLAEAIRGADEGPLSIDVIRGGKPLKLTR
jgi:hypothetical protein